ncbi:UNVERIFIED_CONTAM: hypothetical protein HDU68_000804 [Siphonaria sp. JEL0065]|nr:hypothetical protein HDU68_000804 [Siphonaria sp. JEL0065]
MIEISGSDGGGQLLRNAMAYSAISGTAFSMHSIRMNRSPPGLRPQHLTGAQLIATISKGTLDNCSVGSTRISFVPSSSSGANPAMIEKEKEKEKDLNEFTADTQTAGSVTLLVQCMLPVLLLATSSQTIVVLKGGTNATLAPQLDFLLLVFNPFMLHHFGIAFSLDLILRGFYPRGGGIVHLTVDPMRREIIAITLLDPGTVMELKGRVIVGGNTPLSIGKRMKDAAVAKLMAAFPGIPVNVEIDDSASKTGSNPCIGSGSGIVLYTITSTGCTIAGSSVGHSKTSPEDTASLAVTELVRNVKEGGCVDDCMQDQIILFLALAKGTSRVLVGKITDHTRSAIDLAHQMTEARFTIELQSENSNIISCTGIGFLRVAY